MVHFKKTNKNNLNPIKQVCVYKYNVKLQGLSFIFIFYYLDSRESMSQEKCNFLILCRSMNLHFFLFREIEACFAIVVMYMYTAITYLMHIFFLKYSYPVLYIRDTLNSCPTVNDLSVEK